MDRALQRRSTRDRRRAEGKRLVAAVAVALTVGAMGGWMARPSVGGGGDAPQEVVTAPAPAAATAVVRFVFHAPEAQQVSVAGTFNDWNPETLPMIRGADGTYYAIVELPRGRHEYMIVVDGEWRMDPAAPIQADDGFGSRNGVLEV